MTCNINRTTRPRAEQRGTAVIEFALAFTIIVLILFGIADLARGFFTAIEVVSAAEAGTEYALNSTTSWSGVTTLPGATTTGITNAVNNDASDISSMNVSSSLVCKCSDGDAVTCGSGGCSPKKMYVAVTVSKTYSTLFSYAGLPGSVSLSKTQFARVQ